MDFTKMKNTDHGTAQSLPTSHLTEVWGEAWISINSLRNADQHSQAEG